ncbi:MAG: hypothetical protein WCI18_01545 [Pseudomonadota bacterium]
MKILAMLVLVASGCTAKLEYLSIDQEFTPRQLKVGYLLVADPVMDDAFLAQGATASSRDVKQGDPTIQPISDSESQILGKILLERIHDENEKLKVDALERYQKIPASAIQSLKQSIKASKEVPQEFLNTYSENFMSFPNPYRFLGTVRIEAESKFQDYFNREERQKNEKGEIELFRVDEWRSYRKITARMQIFDLKLKKLVFDGIQTRMQSSSREQKTRESKGSFISISLGKREQYPPFPERKDVFRLLANDFAQNLPNEDND